MSGDFLAMQDVLNDLAENSDSLSAEEAVRAREDLAQLEAVLKRTYSMVETALRRHLEAGSREQGGKVYALAQSGKWRYRHRDILNKIADQAARPDADGVLPTALDAARAAAKMTFETYSSNSTKPKETQRRNLGFQQTEDVADWEKTGTEIEVVDLNEPKGAQ